MQVENTRIAIYGAGAMGTVLGAFLTKGGLQVDLITRNQEHVDSMKKNGATVVCSANGGAEIHVPVKALLPAEMCGCYDVIFLMTKQRYNEEVLENLLPYMHADTIVCTTQNGLPEPSVAEVVGNARTYGAATSFGATFLGGGKVELTSDMRAMRMEVSGYQNGNNGARLLVDILNRVGEITGNEHFAVVSENFIGARWSKLAINAAFSGLSVITGMTFGEIARKDKTRKLALCVLRECIAVANASGVQLAKMQGHDMEKMLGGNTSLKRFIAYLVLPFAMRKHKKLVSGMLKDLENGKRCEIDFINGAVVKAGKEVGVETPCCQAIVEMTHAIENGFREIAYDNVIDFFRIMDYLGETF